MVVWLMRVVLAALLLGSIDGWAQTRGITLQRINNQDLAPYSGGTYRALLIGNNDYQDSNGPWQPLKTAVAGARALKGLLEERYGFSDVTLLENATRREVLIALQALSRRTVANDSVIMYYAGHGFLNIETNKGYWVPVDGQNTDHTTFLRNSTIRDELSTIASRAKHTLLISDSCFSGTLLRRGTRGITTRTVTDSYYRKVANKKSIQILTAGGVEYVDDNYKTSGHSPFTYFLLNELKTNDHPLLTASELSVNVEKAVANNVDQAPESGVLQGAGDELGEFIFINLNVAVEGISKEKVNVKVNITETEADAETAQPLAFPSDTILRLGVKLSGTRWTGSNDDSDTNFAAGGGQLGTNLAFQKGRFFTGFNLQYAGYDFDDEGPDQISDTESTSFRDVKIGHSELDLAVGYFFWKPVALFVNLQAVGNRWDNNDYDMSYGGIGLGILGRWPFAQNWELISSLNLMPSTTVEGDGEKIADATSLKIELGAGYYFNKHHRLGFGLNLHGQNYEFDNGDKQDHQITGLFFSYHSLFHL